MEKKSTSLMEEATVELKITLDGSTTLYAPAFEQHYHSVHGAMQESLHVFIEAGLFPQLKLKDELTILEVGFGTGLNAVLTYFKALGAKIRYIGIDAYPVPAEVTGNLNYADQIGIPAAVEVYREISEANWDESTRIGEGFELLKVHSRLEDYEREEQVDLIYFDAFAPNAQPELWTQEIFSKLFALAKPGAILTTYSAKGDVRRAMLAAGFQVEKLPGPPGKREMLRAWKN